MASTVTIYYRDRQMDSAASFSFSRLSLWQDVLKLHSPFKSGRLKRCQQWAAGLRVILINRQFVVGRPQGRGSRRIGVD